MFSSRKVKIWSLSLAVLIVLFVLYSLVNQTPALKVAGELYEYTDFNVPGMEGGAGRIGNAQVGNIEEARFETLDRKTKRIKRVIGFAKVLHKTGDLWDIDKPFMNLFEDDYTCDLTADSGSVQVETVEGNPRPKDAVLTGNVSVHIVPRSGSEIKEGYIYLDDITYDSDRSMFTTPGRVRYISADAELLGRGLEIIYDNENSRMVMLKVIKIDFLRIKLPSKSVPSQESPDTADSQKSVSVEPREAEIAAASSPAPTNDNPPPQQPQQSVQGRPQPVDDARRYVCSFTDNVVVEYGRQMIFTNELTVSDITGLNKKDKKQQSKPSASSPPAPPAKEVFSLSTSPPAATVTVVSAEKPQPPRQTTEALVKCDGPMVFQLAENYKKPTAWNTIKTFSGMTEEIKEKIKDKDVLIAQLVDHNLGSEITEAYGPLEIYFYTNPDQQDNSVPARITAKQSARFLPHLNRAEFTGDVIGGMTDKSDYYDEENIFYGQRLVVDLVKTESSEQGPFGNSAIGHVTLSQGDAVILESIRRSEGKLLSQTRLACAQLDFNRVTRQIVTTGAGQIQLSRPEMPSLERTFTRSGSGMGMDKPCFALMEGFDQLRWDMDSMKITVDSDTTSGIHIGYLPIINGEYGKKTTIDTRHIEVDYIESVPGRGGLKSLLAAGGIVYYEQGRYEFEGERLFYDAANSFMVVSGDGERLCRLNGVPAKGGIEYNLRTGRAKAMLGSGIGTLPTRKEE